MQASFRRWWRALPPQQHPIEQQQAPALQLFLVALVVAATLWMGLPLFTKTSALGIAMSFAAAALVVGSNIVAIYLLRNRQFRSAVMVSVISLTVGVAVVIWLWGLRSGNGVVVVFTVCITMTGLLASWRSVVTTAVVSVAIVIAAAVTEAFAPAAIGIAPFEGDPNILTAGTFILVVAVLTVLFLQFGLALRRLHAEALTREQELEQLRASLTATVAELQQALHSGERREAELQQTLAKLGTSQEAVRQLSAPIVPVLPGVLVAPLVGAIDAARADILMANVLGAVEQQRGKTVIFDITGVPIVDTRVAQVLMRTAQAIGLLGAQVILVGVRPEVAQTIVALGVLLDSITTYADLQEAVTHLLPSASHVSNNTVSSPSLP